MAKFYCFTYDRDMNPKLVRDYLNMIMGPMGSQNLNYFENYLFHLWLLDMPAEKLDKTPVDINAIGLASHDAILVMPSDIAPYLNRFKGKFTVVAQLEENYRARKNAAVSAIDAVKYDSAIRGRLSDLILDFVSKPEFKIGDAEGKKETANYACSPTKEVKKEHTQTKTCWKFWKK